MTTPNEELMARAKRLRNELDDSNSRLDRQCVTAMYEMEQALRSQAERIKELELDLDVQAGSIEAVQAANSRLAAERDTLRAEIAAIDATEPIARAMSDKTNTGYVYVKVLAGKLQFGTNLYSHPMPAQDVEASMVNLPEPVAWLANYGGNVYTEAQLKQAVRDALDALKDVAQTLAWVQHGKCRGFSDGLLTTDEALDKARTALSKYKGVK